MKITATVLQKLLNDQGVYPDQLSRKHNGNFIARKGFFYRHGKTDEDWKKKIIGALIVNGISFIIMDAGEVYKAFRGGAKLANQSHWYVVFNVLQEGKTNGG